MTKPRTPELPDAIQIAGVIPVTPPSDPAAAGGLNPRLEPGLRAECPISARTRRCVVRGLILRRRLIMSSVAPPASNSRMSRSGDRSAGTSPFASKAGIGIASAHNISKVAINPSSSPDDRMSRLDSAGARFVSPISAVSSSPTAIFIGT